MGRILRNGGYGDNVVKLVVRMEDKARRSIVRLGPVRGMGVEYMDMEQGGCIEFDRSFTDMGVTDRMMMIKGGWFQLTRRNRKRPLGSTCEGSFFSFTFVTFG